MDAHIPHTPAMVSQSASSAVHPRILARPHMPALPIPRVLGTAGNLCDGSVSAASGVLPQVVHAHLGGHEGDHQDAPQSPLSSENTAISAEAMFCPAPDP